MAAPRCEALADSRCVLVSAAGTLWQEVLAARRLQFGGLCKQKAAMRAPTDRASWRLLQGARRRPTQAACSSVPLALCGVGCLPPRIRHLPAGGFVLATESRHEAPNDRASVRLLHGARRRPTQGVCSSLLLVLCDAKCLPPGTRHLQMGLSSQRKAAMKLRMLTDL